MNYLNLIRSFRRRHRQEDCFSGNEALLYLCLVDLFNDEGEGEVWPETVRFMDPILCSETGLSPGTLEKARKVLEHRGLIRFVGATRGKRNGGEYRLVEPERTSRRTLKRTPISEELDERTPENENLLAKEPQEVPQQEPQQEPQNLGNSHIYIESKQTNVQTAKHSLSNEGDAAETKDSLGTQKKGAIGQPPTPFQKPIPIPPGKVYGDGTLQSDILIFYAQNPEPFPLKIYLPFLRYWSATMQKGNPGDIGRERWRVRWGDDWQLEERLTEWYQRELNPKNGSNQTTAASFHARQQSAEPTAVDKYSDL